jgi:hypothetical protein
VGVAEGLEGIEGDREQEQGGPFVGDGDRRDEQQEPYRVHVQREHEVVDVEAAGAEVQELEQGGEDREHHGRC